MSFLLFFSFLYNLIRPVRMLLVLLSLVLGSKLRSGSPVKNNGIWAIRGLDI